MFYKIILTAVIEVVATTPDTISDNLEECKRIIVDSLEEVSVLDVEFHISPPETWKQD